MYVDYEVVITGITKILISQVRICKNKKKKKQKNAFIQCAAALLWLLTK